jgi:hypothetical protein
MTEVRDFVTTLVRAGKSQKEIKPLVDAAYGDKALSRIQIKCIIKAVKEGKNNLDQRHSSMKKMKRTGNILVSIARANPTAPNVRVESYEL